MLKVYDKERIIDELERAIDAENTTSICYSRLASLIKNGRIRNKFRIFSDMTKANKELLISRLNSLGVNNFLLEEKCTFCKINLENFSLIGAIDLGLEITNTAIKFYRGLLNLSNNFEDKKLFKKLLKDKNEQRDFLKREKRFPRKGENKINFIYSYCIPEVISNLWK